MTPWTLRLIVANTVMFLMQQLFAGLTYALMFVPALALQRPWTPVTYMFLHGGLGHLFFNMLGLFFFGPRLEERLGGNRFLQLYFFSGLVAAALSFVLSPNAAIIGASGAIYGIFLAFARFWPRERIYIYGVLPIEARWFVLIMTVISLWSGWGGGGGGIAHFAHLGGFLGGLLYTQWVMRRPEARAFQRRAAPAPARSSSPADLERWSRIERERLHEVNRAEVDRILDKISAQGLGSLTPGEREVLDRFSQQR